MLAEEFHNTIYQKIWEEDENGAVVVSADSGIENAQVILDEQVKANGRREIDLATRPLFKFVDDELLSRPTYSRFINLLDNYVVNFRSEEISSPQERKEEQDFIDECLKTKVMQIAYNYISNELKPGLTMDEFRSELLTMWFERYTNYYRGRSTRFCSGFEHVFVGEGRYDGRRGLEETMGEISGYHSWIKFYLDEVAGRVNFLGYKYDLRGNQGPDNPNVVTLQMKWNHLDFNGELVARLFKRKGGFFVGSSPEAEIALGTLAFYQSAAGLADNDKIPVSLGQVSRLFNLVIYRNITQGGRRGKYIRSFFPEYLGGGAIDPLSEPNGDRVVVRSIRGHSRNDGRISIVAAMPDPLGRGDEEGEWIEIRNNSESDINISNWELRDRMERPEILEGTLESKTILKIDIIRKPNGLQLGNRGGLISLVTESADLVAQVSYGRTEEGTAIIFVQQDDSPVGDSEGV